MAILTEQQRQRALAALREYLGSPKKSSDLPPDELDQKRVQLIGSELGQLVRAFLTGAADLPRFKSAIDSINKRNPWWGFKGIKGQMFFNLVVNVSDGDAECVGELKAAIAVPSDNAVAASRIKTFASYINRLRAEWIESGHTAHGAPKLGSIPFFLSYFWQVQERQVWPVYYTNTVNTLADMNLWQATGDLAADYVSYKSIHEELIDLFTKEAGQPFDLYKVEHVFWFHGSNTPQEAPNPTARERPAQSVIETVALNFDRLPESFVPPVISIMPQMSRNEPMLIKLAEHSGTALSRAFEKSIHAAFTILGFQTKLLGAGQGRVPDGEAIAGDERYAVVWDAKVRADGYSIGTDDRVIREYISTRSRELKKRGALRNIYYAIISSTFLDDYDDAILAIKMETDVNEVCLLEAAALVAMVDAKLRAPLDLSLGADGLQRFFANGGLVTAAAVQEALS